MNFYNKLKSVLYDEFVFRGEYILAEVRKAIIDNFKVAIFGSDEFAEVWHRYLAIDKKIDVLVMSELPPPHTGQKNIFTCNAA